MITYRVTITTQAEIDISSIDDYISNDLLMPKSARSITGFIRRKIFSLSINPERGRIYENNSWQGLDIRSVRVKNYLVIFAVNKKSRQVIILHVEYSRRDIEELLH